MQGQMLAAMFFVSALLVNGRWKGGFIFCSLMQGQLLAAMFFLSALLVNGGALSKGEAVGILQVRGEWSPQPRVTQSHSNI